MYITQYWINALPFASKEEAQAAIEEFELTAPHDVCLITPFSRDGIFVRVLDYDAGTSGWLTTELFQGFGMALDASSRQVMRSNNTDKLPAIQDLHRVAGIAGGWNAGVD